MTKTIQTTLEVCGLIIAICYLGSLLMLWSYPPPFALSSVTGGSPCSGWALSVVTKDPDLYFLSPEDQVKRLRVKQAECEALEVAP